MRMKLHFDHATAMLMHLYARHGAEVAALFVRSHRLPALLPAAIQNAHRDAHVVIIRSASDRHR